MNTPSYLTVELLQKAQQIVKASPLYKRFIDGTPLENDIAVWMADFAGQALHDAEVASLAASSVTRAQEEAKAILLVDLLRFTKHAETCRFYSRHRTDCAKWQGFHESRYLDDAMACTCGTGQPCSCGLHAAATSSDGYVFVGLLRHAARRVLT